MSKSKRKKFDLDAAKDFAIKECTPKKKREILAQQAVWELYKELEKERAAEIELEIEEDDSEFDEESALKSKESQPSPSLLEQVVSQAKVFGAAGLMTITTGVYFQSQAVIENVEDIRATVAEMSVVPTQTVAPSSSSSLSDGLDQSNQTQSLAEDAAEASSTNTESVTESEAEPVTESESETTTESESESVTESESEATTEAETVIESKPEPVTNSDSGTTDVVTEEPVVVVENNDEEETQPEPIELIEPVIIDIPLPNDVEIPSSQG